MAKKKMTSSEALVETLVAEGVKDVFGLVGSAFMDALDLFPDAGIRFIPVAHEQVQVAVVGDVHQWGDVVSARRKRGFDI